MPRACNSFTNAFCNQNPIDPSVIATHVSNGIAGFFSESAAACCNNKLPTCGPLP